MAMSMRSRGGAVARRPRSGVRPVYEDFKPSSEWKHEETADILLYNLPGFLKEQIRIIAESRGILRVRGERLVAGNKWSRFEEEVAVPDYCNLSEIRAKFEGGVLRITMPKKMTATNKKHIIEETSNTPSKPLDSGVVRSNAQPKPPALQEDSSSKPILPTNMVKPQGTSLNPPSSPPAKALSEPRNKILDDITTTPSQPPSGVRKSQTIEDYISRHFPYHEKGKASEDSQTKDDFERNITSMEAEHQRHATSLMKENEIKSRQKANTMTYEKEKHEKFANEIDRKQDKINKLEEGYAHYKNFAKSLIPQRYDEDRQLLVNMGAAVLVIMALGACVSYSLGSNN